MAERQFPDSSISDERIMKHFFVLGEHGYTMSYSTTNGEWAIDKSEPVSLYFLSLEPIEIVEYYC